MTSQKMTSQKIVYLYYESICYLCERGHKLVTVVINMIVNEVSTVHIKGVREMYFLWNRGCPEDRNEVCSSGDAVEMNDGENAAAVPVKLGGDHPHSCIAIWIIKRCEPLNKSAWTALAIIHEGKQKADTPDHHSPHAAMVCIGLDENGVIPRVFPPPVWVGAYPFLMHTTSATKVARCEKACDRRMKHRNPALKHWTVFEKDLIRWYGCIWI